MEVFRRLNICNQEQNQMIELELYRHEMQHFVNILQEYVINQILDISTSPMLSFYLLYFFFFSRPSFPSALPKLSPL